MIYVDNTSEYSQRIYIPKDEVTPVSGYTPSVYAFQRKDYTINENGLTVIRPDAGFDAITGGTIQVFVPPATGDTEFVGLSVTENGVYVPTGNTAYSSATVSIDTQSFYDQGFSDGYESGYTQGYAIGYDYGLENGRIEGFQEGYSSGKTDGYQEGYEIGYSEAYVSGHTDGYAEGYLAGVADGAAQQKALLTSTTITQNGEYTSENGFSAVTVQVQDGGYQEGYQDGIAHQKSLLGTHDFTANTGPDAVVFPDGISSATVNIPVQSIMFTASTNGEYSYIPQDYLYSDVRILVDVPQTGITPTLSSITVTQNGVYGPPAGADGISSVHAMFDTATPFNSGYTSGYTEGFLDGEASGETTQKSKLQAFTATTNGTWTREDGWSAVTVNMNTAGTYNSGYTAGVSAQKGLLTSTAFTENGTFQRENGWNQVTVDIPMGNVSIKNNGVYSASTSGYQGFDVVEVNVSGTQPLIVTCTQAEYNTLNPPDPNTIYLIKD